MSVLRPGQENRAFDALKRSFIAVEGGAGASCRLKIQGLAGGVVHESAESVALSV